ncbi:hypothetical protein [Paraburkholderia sp. BL25I1N1]|uniref:hypothetical protein n=1 Tax=Paraburkholderia sp. BL25I1N1 TaxID=1938804 RepID=UPI000D055B4F|nr:hypothetical protein [Paraburkholderia sp. BL25I1N1]PRY04424.1 hypothetical protein B0G73_112100 [Paraburkholderia sp. BL25I1N1]
MSIQNPIGSISSFADRTATETGKKTAGSSFQALLNELTDYTKGTLNQRLEKQILAKLGISEDDLKTASPEVREKIMEIVRNLMKQEASAQVQQAKAKS